MSELSIHFYLSDDAHNWIKRGARYDGVSMGEFIEDHAKEWTSGLHVQMSDEVCEAIRAREARKMLLRTGTTVERNDVGRARYETNSLHDGVIWRMVFGVGRQPRELKISADVVKILADWIVREGVVRKRAAQGHVLAGQALELIGRGWVEVRRE